MPRKDHLKQIQDKNSEKPSPKPGAARSFQEFARVPNFLLGLPGEFTLPVTPMYKQQKSHLEGVPKPYLGDEN